MADTIIMPQLGETVAEGKILTWFKAVGDEVKIGDKLFEVETDKVTIEVEAIEAGKISEIRVGDGVAAKVGSVVAVLNGAVVPHAPTTKSAVAPQQKPPAAPVAFAQPVVVHPPGVLLPFEEVRTPIGRYGKPKASTGIAMSPLARRTAAQQKLDPNVIAVQAAVKGLRRVSEKDVAALAVVASAQPAAPALPFKGIRLKIAEKLSENWRTIPHVFQGIEVDFTHVDKTRDALKDPFKKANGFSLTYLPFIARAVCLALKDYPKINSTLEPAAFTTHAEVNLGIAVDLDHQGLVVPVIKNAGTLNVAGLAKAIVQLAEKAKANKLTVVEMTGGTYSITNNGAFGTMFTAPIINAPQVGILSTDAIRLRPTVVGDKIEARMMGILGQSFDHRAFDGAYAASFLSRLKQILETHDWNKEVSS